MESSGYELTSPNYSEIMHSAEKSEKSTEETAEEIKDDVLRKLKG